MTPPRESTGGTSWLQPSPEEEGLKRYVETIRERIWLVVIALVVTTGAAILYVATAQKTYEATSQLLVTPTPATDPVVASLGLLVESSDPTRDIETATQLVKTPQVAALVKTELHSPESTQGLLSMITSSPVAQSNLVAVQASANSADEARDLANSFAKSTVQERTNAFQDEVNARLQQLQNSPTAGKDVQELQALQGAPDPNFRVATVAETPAGPSSPRPLLSIAAGIFAGLVLGIGGAFLSQTLDPTLRREAQLRRLYRLPILARVPRQGGRRGRREPLGPRRLAPAGAEAYRTLRATVAQRHVVEGKGGQVVLVTGPSAGEGKSTTAVNLASSLSLTGKDVILIETDLRRPSLGPVLGMEPSKGGVVSVLIENTRLATALTSSSTYGPNLRVLLADQIGTGWITDLFSIPAADAMVKEARRLADYVVIDSPPLNEVVDALPLARQADDVLIVVRLGTTRLDRLNQLAELLAESDITPIGFTVVGASQPGRSGYYYAAAKAEADGKRPSRLPRRASSKTA
jgi:Mrp family chromosome partitioning ATPase/capsular polysaccharide biosynthesis protein